MTFYHARYEETVLTVTFTKLNTDGILSDLLCLNTDSIDGNTRYD